MKKLLISSIMFAIVSNIFSQTIIYTKDGKSINVPVNSNDILRIEFTTPSSPQNTVIPSTVSNPMLGKWLRKEGGTTAEYMEIIQGKGGEIEMNFRSPSSDNITFKGLGTLQNGEIKSKFTQGSKRKYSLRLNTSNQIEYTSSELDGTKPWSCVWTRVN